LSFAKSLFLCYEYIFYSHIRGKSTIRYDLKKKASKTCWGWKAGWEGRRWWEEKAGRESGAKGERGEGSTGREREIASWAEISWGGEEERDVREHPSGIEGGHQFKAFNFKAETVNYQQLKAFHIDSETAPTVQRKIGNLKPQEKYQGGVRAGKEEDWNASEVEVGDDGKEVRC
jgi:hypothetical protein